MAVVHWFPGHMMKSMRMMQENIGLVDCILYILDARIPGSCINPFFETMSGDLPILYILNKSDLADPAETDRWLKHLTTPNSRALAVTATQNRAVGDVVKTIAALDLKRVKKQAEKGFNYTPRAMVVGVPNTGKSTVINMLCGKAKAITGNKAGVTRGKQWVRVENVVDLLDTPGTLPQRINDETAGNHLAIVGSVRDEVVDVANLAYALIVDLQQFSGVLNARYGVDESGSALEIMEGIARARGFLMRGGEFDYDRAANAILDDYRKGRLGRITLEKAECWTTK